MFLNEGIFKKLCKTAYKRHGLIIERRDGLIAIMPNCTYPWRVEILNEYLSKKGRAALTEIVGELPEDGETYEYQKKQEPQKFVDGIICRYLKTTYENLKEEYVPTRLLVECNGGMEAIYQDTKNGNKIYINNEFKEMIKRDNIEDKKGETVPGNAKVTVQKDQIIWANNVMAISAPVLTPWSIGEEELLVSIGTREMDRSFMNRREEDE